MTNYKSLFKIETMVLINKKNLVNGLKYLVDVD